MALSCFEPNLYALPLNKGTFQVLQQQQQGLLPKPLPCPIFNVGLPKMGSSTFYDFFTCAGLCANHGMNSRCFAQAQQRGLPMLSTCSPLKKESKQSQNATLSLVQAWLQMDINYPPKACYYPQTSMLDKLHCKAPNATFVLNF
ncbi:hypothetical protein ACA910_005424 [Epithemia clementina (nom. ined.)]